MHVTTTNEETMNLKKSGEGYMEGFEARKGKEEMIRIIVMYMCLLSACICMYIPCLVPVEARKSHCIS